MVVPSLLANDREAAKAAIDENVATAAAIEKAAKKRLIGTGLQSNAARGLLSSGASGILGGNIPLL